MSNVAHLILLVVAAVMVGAVLTIGTLGAADLLPRRRKKEESRSDARQKASSQPPR